MDSQLILSDPYNPQPENTLEFRLIYGGLLLGANKSDTRSRHKHDVRQVFHHQLKTLWDVSPNLREWVTSDSLGQMVKTKDRLASIFPMNGVHYVPLSFDGLGIACKLDVLMLRPEQPGMTLLKGGDIDNRLKTLFDALRMPQAGEIMESEGGQSPFFCLLQDDSLINHLSVATDLLLGAVDKNEVRLVITVNMWPVVHTMLNMGIF